MMPETNRDPVDTVMTQLVARAKAQGAFVIDRAGQIVTASGDLEEIDSTSLASLTAGNVAAAHGIGQLLLAGEFSAQFHEGKDTHVHIRLVGRRMILVVIFGESSSLGLVRLRAREASDALHHLFDQLVKKAKTSVDLLEEELTDGDIEELFKH